MKRTATLLALLLVAGLAAAQEEPKPDYSRDTLLRLFVGDEDDDRDGDVRFHVGAVEFGALGTRWRFNYLPIMAPLPGTRFATTREWPDAFALTGTPIATPPRAWRTQREMNAELRRIDRVTRSRATVRVDVNGD